MKKIFWCATHERYEPREIYAGNVGMMQHCLESIAGARENAKRRKAESRREEIAREAKAKTGKSARKMAINPIKGEARRKIEDILECRKLAKIMELDYV